MVHFKVVGTSFAAEARKLANEIASLPDDWWKEVQSKHHTTALLHLPSSYDITVSFRDELNKTLIQSVQQLVREAVQARIRKPQADEYALPPMVVKGSVWLEFLENEMAIIQTFHDPSKSGKLKMQNKQGGEVCEVELQHDSVIVVIGRARCLPEPDDIPYLMQKLFIEPIEVEAM
ncbi:hypothetical protein T440DRAFT_472949 [Plenodomus tracheiphilus IPT5]|uniref:Uncharacterized protein n=1 Tax=Plenodomus tracheiphilus IPT5 TaxID=1408161 RepID=A0A6A7AS34_9PLEO|nr:hypothetical protein T440DRAFT_472949 [Plenodomus tracheiphilus IPT5]